MFLEEKIDLMQAKIDALTYMVAQLLDRVDNSAVAPKETVTPVQVDIEELIAKAPVVNPPAPAEAAPVPPKAEKPVWKRAPGKVGRYSKEERAAKAAFEKGETPMDAPTATGEPAPAAGMKPDLQNNIPRKVMKMPELRSAYINVMRKYGRDGADRFMNEAPGGPYVNLQKIPEDRSEDFCTAALFAFNNDAYDVINCAATWQD